MTSAIPQTIELSKSWRDEGVSACFEGFAGFDGFDLAFVAETVACGGITSYKAGILRGDCNTDADFGTEQNGRKRSSEVENGKSQARSPSGRCGRICIATGHGR